MAEAEAEAGNSHDASCHVRPVVVSFLCDTAVFWESTCDVKELLFDCDDSRR